MPGGAAGQLPAFEQHHIRDAQLGQVVGDGAADDAAADDDDVGAGRDHLRRVIVSQGTIGAQIDSGTFTRSLRAA